MIAELDMLGLGACDFMLEHMICITIIALSTLTTTNCDAAQGVYYKMHVK